MVKLTNEQGFTYGAGLQTLAAAISSDVDDARIRGNSLTLRSAFSYDAAANMQSGGKHAFIDATKFKFMSMMEAASLRLEHQLLYGGSGLGIVASADDGADSITFTDASWAPGLWSGLEGAEIDVYDAAGAILRVSTSITSIDHDTKTISLASGADLSTVIGTDVVWFKGAKGNEMVGLRDIVSNTGNLYGINGADYSLWKGNTSAVGGNLTLRKIYDGIAKAVSKGLMDDVCNVVSPATFAVLANDQASLRRYDAKYSSSESDNGFEAVKFHGQNGKIEIIAHPMMREGEAIAFPKKYAERIGATDITFKTPGSEGGEMFRQLDTQTGYECRLYSEQAVFLPCPAKGILFTGITNA